MLGQSVSLLLHGCSHILGSDPCPAFTVLCRNMNPGELFARNVAAFRILLLGSLFCVWIATGRGKEGRGGRIYAQSAAVPGPSAAGLGCVEP